MTTRRRLPDFLSIRCDGDFTRCPDHRSLYSARSQHHHQNRWFSWSIDCRNFPRRRTNDERNADNALHSIIYSRFSYSLAQNISLPSPIFLSKVFVDDILQGDWRTDSPGQGIDGWIRTPSLFHFVGGEYAMGSTK